MKKCLPVLLSFLLLLPLLLFTDCATQRGSTAGKYGKGLIVRGSSGRSPASSKSTKVREPKAVVKAKKEQQKRERQIRKENEKAAATARARHFSIQSDPVKERMKQNKKETASRDKAWKKSVRKASRPAAKRYKR